MLRKIEIGCYRGLKDIVLSDIGKINVIIGENNSGKTSILEALQLLCGREITEPDLNLIYHELRLRLQHHEAPDVTLAWLLHLLEAYQS